MAALRTAASERRAPAGIARTESEQSAAELRQRLQRHESATLIQGTYRRRRNQQYRRSEISARPVGALA
jgi:hypothetical protein